MITGKLLTGFKITACKITGILINSVINAFCLIKSGILQNATFERSGDVVTTSGTLGPNEEATIGGKYFHFGQITETTPAYGISPLVRPTSPDVYDTCASAPNPDKHGANWELTDPKNGWALDLLDGSADGVELIVAFENRPDSNGYEVFSNTVDSMSCVNTIDAGIAGAYVLGDADDYIEIRFDISEYTGSTIILAEREISTVSPPILILENISSGSYRIRYKRVYSNSIFTFTLGGGNFDSFIASGISFRQTLPATGTLTLKPLSIVPTKTEWQTVGDFNILSGDDDVTVNQILYVEETTGLICAKDDAGNICKSLTEYAAGTDPIVSLVFGDGQMQWVVDGVKGGLAPFSGHFPVGVTLKWGFENEDVWYVGGVCGSTTATFGEALQLAQDLAFDL